MRNTTRTAIAVECNPAWERPMLQTHRLLVDAAHSARRGRALIDSNLTKLTYADRARLNHAINHLQDSIDCLKAALEGAPE